MNIKLYTTIIEMNCIVLYRFTVLCASRFVKNIVYGGKFHTLQMISQLNSVSLIVTV